MKILLTGSAGFIGSVIAEKLKRPGNNVSFLDKADGNDARDFFRDNHGGLSTFRYDLVIHCAAQVGGRLLVESPLAHAENLEIDAALFRWAEQAKPGRIVYISSVAAYPAEMQFFPSMKLLSEDDIDLADVISPPDQLYGWAKLTGELMASRSSIPVSIPRPFTVYGEGQDGIFPFASLIQQVREYRDPVTVWGSGTQVRDFIHVDDVADGIIAMAEQEVDGPVNFCTGNAISLRDLARKMAVTASWLGGSHHYDPEIKTLPDKPEGLAYRVGSPRLLNKFYTPKISLQEGIERGLRSAL